jgi:hypothetical protein
MTVISTVISRYCTVHASDSFITTSQADGRVERDETQQSKIVPVRHWRGAVSYWGLAGNGQWSTFDWLQQQARSARNFSSPEDFAGGLACGLNRELPNMHFHTERDSGIGIHFTAYERIGDYWVPELFLISNWTDPSYESVHPEVRVSRETYHIAFQCAAPRPEHREEQLRLAVYQFLQEGQILTYNNGDPILFNIVAKALHQVFRELARRGVLKSRDSIEMYCFMAKRPVEIVSELQRDFCRGDFRVVVGRIHDLAITPDGQFSSTSGDEG